MTLKRYYINIINQLPIDVAVLNKNKQFEFINKKAIKNNNLRKSLIGLKDEDYFKIQTEHSHLSETITKKIDETINNKVSISWIDEHKNKGHKSYIPSPHLNLS